MTIESNISAQNLLKSKTESSFYTNIPDLKEEMLCENYWIKSLDMNKVIMNLEEIDTYNKINEKNSLPIVNLENYKELLSKKELIDKINTVSTPSQYERFHEDGNLVTKEYYDRIIKNCNYEEISSKNNINYGITVKRTNMRTFPTFDKVFKAGDNYEFDRFQETAVYPIEPLIIINTSKDGNWYFAQMYNYLAWIPKCDVAISSKEELFQYINTENFIVTTGKRVFTNYNPLNEQLSEIKFDMGVRIPLVNIKEIKGDIYGQNPTGNHVVKLPTRGDNGNVVFELALIARSEDVSVGYLPYTRENIIVHAFKFLGERYGWGGMFNSRDCAGFIMDIYRTMGIKLPRNSEEQGKLTQGDFYDMSEGMTIEDRENLLDSMLPGIALYMSGHAMIYLGNEEGINYAIHDFSGFYNAKGDGSIEYHKSRQVMVAPLNIGLAEDGKKYIEGIYGARDFVL